MQSESEYTEYSEIKGIEAPKKVIGIPFAKGNKGRPKGSLNKATIMKQDISEVTMTSFKEWLQNDGISKFKREMARLEGKDYIASFAIIAEYFIGKKIRTSIDEDKAVNVDSITFE